MDFENALPGFVSKMRQEEILRAHWAIRPALETMLA
jgi:hypothetical protein